MTKNSLASLVVAAILIAGLALEVRDAISGEPAAYGAEGEIRDGSYSDRHGGGGGGRLPRAHHDDPGCAATVGPGRSQVA